MIPDKDTLAYQLKMRPSTMHIDRTKVPVALVASRVEHYRETHDASRSPEGAAISFYLMNHALSVVKSKKEPEEPLAEFLPVVEEYHRVVADEAARMLSYLLLICTRESRHASISADLASELKAEFGNSLVGYTKSLASKGSTGAAQQFQNNPPQGLIGNYTAYLCKIFYNAGFGSSFGGPAWGKVADCLNMFVTGKYTAEMMLDTAYTLCHNNGPIFNKGMLYTGYTMPEITKILDVQRSGQIPKLVANQESPKVEHAHKVFVGKYSDLLGEDFNGYVDWFVVEALGSVGHYNKEKTAQVQQHGQSKMSEAAAKKLAEAEAKVKAQQELAEKKAAEAKAAEEKIWLEVFPGMKVQKFDIRAKETA